MNRKIAAFATLVTAMIGVGCADPVPELPEPRPLPEIEEYDLTLAQDGPARDVRNAVVRISNQSCYGVSSGSGFFLEPDLVVTNRHVVAGAERVWISTWDGAVVDGQIEGVAFDVDVAVIKLDRPVPGAVVLEHANDAMGEVSVIGYPMGGKYTAVSAEIVDRVPGDIFNQNGDVFRIDGRVLQGNSGGPVLDEEDRVTGIVFGVETFTQLGLVIDVDELDSRLDLSGLSKWDTSCRDFVFD